MLRRTANILTRRPWAAPMVWAAAVVALAIAAAPPRPQGARTGDFLPPDAPSRRAVAAMGEHFPVASGMHPAAGVLIETFLIRPLLLPALAALTRRPGKPLPGTRRLAHHD